MDVERDHVFHCRGGKLGAAGTTSRADAKRIITQAIAANPEKGLAIHFHGGLVNTASGTGIAALLAPRYARAGAYPLFFVWESGPVEILKNNLKDIAEDTVFQELVKKVAEWALKQLGNAFTTKGAGLANVNEHKLRSDFDAWFAGQSSAPPVALESPTIRPTATRGVEPDEDDLAALIEAELDNDDRFQQVMAGLYVESGRGVTATTRGGSVPAADVEVLVDDKALDQLFPPPTAGATKGLLTWLKVAKFVAKVVIAVVQRHWNKRDHGTYTTIVEEVLRAAYLDKVGEVVWRMMKKDTADAFAADALSVGTALLADLAELAAQGKTFSQISLIGHSTGAVYINNLLRHAAVALPNAKFNLILLAPASRFDDFNEVLIKHGGQIANFRMFTMTDEWETQDQLVRIIYPRSLLYFISGLLEGDADVPIVGMNRFNTDKDLFNETDFKPVSDVRTWLGLQTSRCVWSVAGGGDGLSSSAKSHGDFDNDEATLLSVEHSIRTGF
jgi:hypothetical protein